MDKAREMHIALLTPGFPADEQDSGCIPALQDYVRALAARRPDWRIHVLAQHYPFTRRPYDWHGVRVIPIGGSNRRWPVSLMDRMRLISALRHLGRIDLIHAFWLGDTAAAAAGHARRVGIPLVVTLMGQEVRRHSRWHRLISQPGVATVAVSDYQRQIMTQSGGPPIGCVIPWGVDAMEIQESRRNIDVLGVGNLISVKDPFGFIRVIAQVVTKVPNLQARWLGGGPLLEPARALTKAMGIDRNLQFTGAIARPDVLSTMARSRVLLHTAEFESFAMVMAEARVHGATVVSRPVGIAASSAGPGFHLAWTEAGLANGVLSALSMAPVPGTRPWPLEASVNAYLRLYGDLCL
jgi:glycosyltransferase involved in cell wall biosynthesis